MKMIRKPSYAGNIKEKDQLDIFYWAFEKNSAQRLSESWRLHCMNNNIPIDTRLDKSFAKAHLRSE